MYAFLNPKINLLGRNDIVFHIFYDLKQNDNDIIVLIQFNVFNPIYLFSSHHIITIGFTIGISEKILKKY